MLPNDPLVALLQVSATIEERQRQSGQERLAATARSAAGVDPSDSGAAPVLSTRNLAERLRAALAGRHHSVPPASDEEPGTAVT